MEQPILNIKYLTEDPEIRAMIDMYWALDENNRPLYKKPDFVAKYGLDTTRLVKKLNEHFVVYSIDDICPKCKEIKNYLKCRKDKYEPRKNWICSSCREKQEILTKELRIETMKKAFNDLTYHCLSPLQLNIFKALMNTRRISHLAPNFGMSYNNFEKYVVNLHHLNLLDYDSNISFEVNIIDDYVELFKNDSPEKKVKSIFGPNNLKIYKQLKRTHPYVYPEIPVCAFVDSAFVESLFTESWHKEYFLNCRVDALVCKENGEPQFAVEFQGSYHSEKKQMEKDDLKRKIIEHVGIPVNYYNYQDLKS